MSDEPHIKDLERRLVDLGAKFNRIYKVLSEQATEVQEFRARLSILRDDVRQLSERTTHG